MTQKQINEIARLASEKMQANTAGYKGRKAWECMSAEYRYGWEAMTRAVLDAIAEVK